MSLPDPKNLNDALGKRGGRLVLLAFVVFGLLTAGFAAVSQGRQAAEAIGLVKPTGTANDPVKKEADCPATAPIHLQHVRSSGNGADGIEIRGVPPEKICFYDVETRDNKRNGITIH